MMIHKLPLLWSTISVGNVWAFNLINQLIKLPPKLFSQQIRKRYYKTLGTSVINSPLSPISLVVNIDNQQLQLKEWLHFKN